MYNTVAAVNGIIELLHHIADADPEGDEINWLAIASLLADARRRMMSVEVALYELDKFERETDPERISGAA